MDAISSWSCILPFLIGIILLRSLSQESLLILVIAFLASIPQILHVLDAKNQTLKSLTYNLYTPAEFILLFIIFNKHIESKRNRILFKMTGTLYLLASLFFAYYFNLSEGFIPEWAALNNLIYTAWILTVLFEQYRYTNERNLDFSSPFLWFIIALLFYAPCTAMIFSMWKYMENTNSSPLKIIHAIFNITMYVLFAVGFLKDKQVNVMRRVNASVN